MIFRASFIIYLGLLILLMVLIGSHASAQTWTEPSCPSGQAFVSVCSNDSTRPCTADSQCASPGTCGVAACRNTPIVFGPVITANVPQSRLGDLRLGTSDASNLQHYLEVYGSASVTGAVNLSVVDTFSQALLVDNPTFTFDSGSARVGIGATSSSAKLFIQGGASNGLSVTSSVSPAVLTSTGVAPAVLGVSTAAGSYGVWATTTSSGPAVYGSAGGVGVKGEILGGGSGGIGVFGDAPIGAVGVAGESLTPVAVGSGAGVFGKGSSVGVRGKASGGGGGVAYGVYVDRPDSGSTRYSLFAGAPSAPSGTAMYLAGTPSIPGSVGTAWINGPIDATRFLATELGPSAIPFVSGRSLALDSSLPSTMAVEGLAFDGSSMWVGYRSSGVIHRVRAADGKEIAQVTTGALPVALAYDGSSVWVLSNESGAKLYRINPADLTSVPIFSVTGATNVTDVTVGGPFVSGSTVGVYVWVTDSSGTLFKVRPDTGAVVATIPLGVAGANAVTFDGTYVWVANGTNHSVSRCLASGSSCEAAFTVASEQNAVDVTADGSYVWVAFKGTGKVAKVRPTDKAVVGTFAAGAAAATDRKPSALAIDGTFLWVANLNATTGSVAKLRLGDPSAVAKETSIAAWTDVPAMAFDGTNVWVGVDAAGPKLMKLSAGTSFGQTNFADGVALAQGLTPTVQSGNLSITGTAIVGDTFTIGGDLTVAGNTWSGSETIKPVAVGSTVSCDNGQYLKGIITDNGKIVSLICIRL